MRLKHVSIGYLCLAITNLEAARNKTITLILHLLCYCRLGVMIDGNWGKCKSSACHSHQARMHKSALPPPFLLLGECVTTNTPCSTNTPRCNWMHVLIYHYLCSYLKVVLRLYKCLRCESNGGFLSTRGKKRDFFLRLWSSYRSLAINASADEFTMMAPKMSAWFLLD